MVLCEMAGNLYVTMKNPAEAEKRYRAMLQKGSSLYQEDKKTYDEQVIFNFFEHGILKSIPSHLNIRVFFLSYFAL